MKHRGIEAKDLKPKKFIDEKVREIREIAGGGLPSAPCREAWTRRS